MAFGATFPLQVHPWIVKECDGFPNAVEDFPVDKADSSVKALLALWNSKT